MSQDNDDFSLSQGRQRYNPLGGERSGGEPDWRGVQRMYGNYDRNQVERPEQGGGKHAGKGPKGYVRSDARIREDVCDYLTAYPDVDASDIEVDVENGIVTLTGTVDDRDAKHEAQGVVEAVRGVREVRNHLRILTGRTQPTETGAEPGGTH